MATPKSLTVTIEDGGKLSHVMYAPLREFKSGSTGYFAGGKLQGEDGDRYQVSCSIVLIGSKPKE